MKIERVTVEVLETPVDLQYVAGGNSVGANWHVLARVFTDDGVQGIGFVVALRPTLIKALAQATEELGQLLVGMEILEVEAARSRLEQAGGWVGPGGMLCLALWPNPTHGKSPELDKAYNRYSELHAQGRYEEALPFAVAPERNLGHSDTGHGIGSHGARRGSRRLSAS